MSNMHDPSFGVNKDLLPHVHLISTYRYTVKAQVQPNEVTSWLTQAPKIARDTAPFFWTYLDRPESGQVCLTWQPLQQMGTRFASDGYIWPSQEAYYQQEVGNGVTLEMYYHQAGYAYGDPVAKYSRRRFRLVPSNAPTPNAPQVDPSLWIVHYTSAENGGRFAARSIQPDPRTPSILETRAYLQRCGQIQRKEFILGDRVNWPQIGWPREQSRPPMYGPNRGVPQSMAYPPYPPTSVGGPPSKRARTGQMGPGAMPQAMAANAPQEVPDDEEDTSRGDMFDHLTPREVSMTRYQQNHEWMEEILSSPYRMGQIGFSDLGLGLKGELSTLTDGIFEAHGKELLDPPKPKPSMTQLNSEQAAEFRKRVTERIDSTTAQIEKMKAEHAKKMTKFKQNSLLTTSEKELRLAVDGSGSDVLRLEGHPEDTEEGATRWPARHNKKVEEIVSQVEAYLNRRAEVMHDLKRIQDGGYQEPAPEPVPVPTTFSSIAAGPQLAAASASGAGSRQPSHADSPQSDFMTGASDIDMGGTAAGLLDQMHTGASTTSTPQPPLSAVHSTAATPTHVSSVPSPQFLPQVAVTRPESGARQDADIRMDDAEHTLPDQGTGSGDWVVVPKNGDPNAAAPASPSSGPSEHLKTSAAPAQQTPSIGGGGAAWGSSKQASAAGTPMGGGGGEGGSQGDQPVDFSSLEDLDDSAGDDGMAGFVVGSGATPGGMSEGGGGGGGGGMLGADDDLVAMEMDSMDNSAFGNAFHGVEGGGGGGGDTPQATTTGIGGGVAGQGAGDTPVVGGT